MSEGEHMKPIGTVTQYFPFIDEATRNVLEVTVAEASDYDDFVQRLCNYVLSDESPVMVVYFAIHHSMLALEYKLIDKIREKYGHHQVLGPNLFASSAYQGAYEDVSKVHEMADAILATEPEDWLALEMHFMKFEADMKNYPKTMYQELTMEKIRELIDSDPNFRYYEIVLNEHLALRAQIDGDLEERLRCIDAAIKISEEFDDRVRKAHLLLHKGSIIMYMDRKGARTALKEAYEIVESSLGIPGMYGNIVYYLSQLDAVRGEFDKAISGCLKAINVRERAGLNTGNASYFLSLFYNIVGDPESGLEWGRMAEDQFKSRPYLIDYALTSQIWSLVLSDRIEEARDLLNIVSKSVLKSGNEDQLAWIYFVTGLMEMEQDEYAQALSSIEQGLQIFEQKRNAFFNELILLNHLAKVEVLSCTTEEIIAPSLAILEEKARSEDLPGILGQVLLLKAEISIINNDDLLLREIIPELQLLIEKDGLGFLKPHFNGLQNRL
jgi:tetratricopeptide (TPR) repeat protein